LASLGFVGAPHHSLGAYERRLVFKNQKLSFNPSWMFLGWFAWLVSLV
jgi:hypothetical protein